MTGLLLLLATGFVLFVLVLIGYTAWSITHPPRRSLAWAVSRGRPSTPDELSQPRKYESWSFTDPTSPSRQLGVWEISGDDPAGPVVVCTHGWGQSRLSVLDKIDALAPISSKIIAWDLPGHGETKPGRALMGTIEHESLIALVQTLQDSAQDGHAETQHQPPIVLYGFSLGANVAITAAVELGSAVAGVVAEAPYRLPWTPAQHVMRMRGMPTRMNLRPALFLVGLTLPAGPFWKGFDREKVVQGVQCPLLVVHGVVDEICPIEEGRAIAGAAPYGSLIEIHNGAHTSLWRDQPEQMADAVRSFIVPVCAPKAAPTIDPKPSTQRV